MSRFMVRWLIQLLKNGGCEKVLSAMDDRVDGVPFQKAELLTMEGHKSCYDITNA